MAVQYSSAKPVDNELLMRLKELRTSIAVHKKSPAYVVFPDKTLIEMATKLPTTINELESLYGVGITKSKQYGEAFLHEIISYINSCYNNEMRIFTIITYIVSIYWSIIYK